MGSYQTCTFRGNTRAASCNSISLRASSVSPFAYGSPLTSRDSLARRSAIFRFDLQRNLLFKLTLFAPIQQIQICLVSKRTTPVRVLWSKENKFAVSQCLLMRSRRKYILRLPRLATSQLKELTALWR